MPPLLLLLLVWHELQPLLAQVALSAGLAP